MTDRIRAIDCPSCGAPIELPTEYQRLFKCQFCGTTLEDLTPPPQKEKEAPKPKVVVHSISPPSAKTYTTTKTDTDTTNSSSVGCWIAVISIGLVIIAVVAVAWASGDLGFEGLNPIEVYSFGLTRLISSDDDTHPDIVGVTYNSDESRRMVYVDFDADPYLRWKSEPLEDEASYSYNHLISDPTAIYLAYEAKLIAFDRADGTILWQQTLSDEVSNICEGCLQIFEGWLLTLTADGVLAGFEAQTGEAAWSVRLNETSRQLISLGGNAAVLDKEEDAVGIQIYAPDTGTRLQRIVPQCPNETFPERPQTLHIYDQVLLSNDGQNLYVPISDYDPGCLQKWDAATLTLEWEARIPNDVLDNFTWEPYLLTDQSLFLSEGHNLFTISLIDESYKTVYSDEDHDLAPLSEKNGMLLTRAERTRGTSEHYLWGLSTAAQSKEWEFASTAGDIFDEDTESFVVDTDGTWGFIPDTVDPIVLEAFTDPGMVTFYVLEPTNGSIVSENSLTVNGNDYTYWMQIIGGDGNHVYLVIDGDIWWVNATNGTELGVWP